MTLAVATMPELTSWQEQAAASSQPDDDMIYYAQDDDHDDLSLTDSFCNLMESLDAFNEHDNEAWANASKNTVATLTETDAMQASSGSLLYVMKGETPADNNASKSDFNSSYRLAFTFEQDDDDQKVQAAAPWLSSAVIATPSSRKNATFDVVKNDDLSTLTEEPVVLASSKSSKRKKAKKSDKKAPKAEKKRHDKKDRKKKTSRCKSTDRTVSSEIVDQAVSNICAIGSTERPAVQPIVQNEQPAKEEQVEESVATAVETISMDSQLQQQQQQQEEEKPAKEEIMSFESQFHDAEDDASFLPDSGSCLRASLPKTIQVQDDCNDSCASLALTDLDDNKSTTSATPTYFRSRQLAPMLGKSLSTAKMWVPDSNESVSSFKLKDLNENKQDEQDENDNKVDCNQSSPELYQAPATPMVFRSRPIAPMKSAAVRTFLPVRATQMTIDLKAKLRAGNNACSAVDIDQAATPEAAGKLYQLRRETGFKDLGLMQHIEECSRLRQTLNSVGDPEVLRKQKIADYIEQFKRQKPRGKQTHGLSEVEVKTQRANLKPTRTKQKYGLKMQEEHGVSS